MLENNKGKKNDLCIHLQKFIRANQTLKMYDRNNEHKKKIYIHNWQFDKAKNYFKNTVVKFHKTYQEKKETYYQFNA